MMPRKKSEKSLPFPNRTPESFVTVSRRHSFSLMPGSNQKHQICSIKAYVPVTSCIFGLPQDVLNGVDILKHNYFSMDELFVQYLKMLISSDKDFQTSVLCPNSDYEPRLVGNVFFMAKESKPFPWPAQSVAHT